MTQPATRTRMPAPIVLVLLVSAILAVLFALAAVGGLDTRDTAWLVDCLAFLAFAYIAVGAALRWRPAQVLGVLIGAGLAVLGLYVTMAASQSLAARLLGYDNLGLLVLGLGVLLAGLLVVPGSSRAWFE